jgi:aminopeptidase
MGAVQGRFEVRDPELTAAAAVAVQECLAVAPGERVLIVTNPFPDVSAISEALYNAVLEKDARPTLLLQPLRTQLDFADEAVYAAIGSNPEVLISMSEEKLGKDRRGIRDPYLWEGRSYDSLLHFLLFGRKSLRSFWSPRITREIFTRTVPIDYGLLRRRCALLKPLLDRAESASIHSSGPEGRGTELHLGLAGRQSMVDDGDFTRAGSGGNLPAGEVFVSPQLGTARGRIVFDGSMASDDGVILPGRPIEVEVESGFVVDIRGGAEADSLRRSLARGAEQARRMEREGALPAGQGEVYARNAYGIGELGIGLNPAAGIVGNVINDEKALGTCHLAVGHNYDEDAPALVHLDGLVRNPTIRLHEPEGGELTIVERGRLAGPLGEDKA